MIIMKKIILTFVFILVATISFANNPTYIIKNIDTENMPIHELESVSNTSYWISMFKFIQDVQNQKNTSSNKIVIKYDGKWKYVIPSSEALIQLDIIISHLCSGSSIKDGSFQKGMKKAFDIAKQDKIIVTIQ